MLSPWCDIQVRNELLISYSVSVVSFLLLFNLDQHQIENTSSLASPLHS